jgi:hypothetical protein
VIKYFQYRYILFLVFAAITGCTCVPDINTPKEISPTDLAHILFIHAHSDYESMKITTESSVLYENVNYQGQGNNNKFNYIDIKEGTSILSIFNYKDSSIIFKSQFNLKKDNKYTFLIYGKEKMVTALLLTDTIVNYSPNNCYIRFLNLSPDAPKCCFELTDDFNYSLPFFVAPKLNTQFVPIHSGNFSMEVLDSSKSFSFTNLQFELKAGKTYSFILRGYLALGHKNSVNCMLIETEH